MFRFPENGALLFEGKQLVSKFYHDLDLDLVGLVGNFFACRTISPSGCRTTSEPNSFIQSCFKEIFGGGRGDAKTFSDMTSPFSTEQLSGCNQLGVFRAE